MGGQRNIETWELGSGRGETGSGSTWGKTGLRTLLLSVERSPSVRPPHTHKDVVPEYYRAAIT